MAVRTMNGKLAIKSVRFPNYALNVYSNNGVSSGMNVCLFPYSSSDLLQHWIPQAQGGDVYKLSTAYPESCNIVLDHFRTEPVDNCDMFTTAASDEDGYYTFDLMDQQLFFDEDEDGYYTIQLCNGGKQGGLVLTCASSVDKLGVGSVSTNLNVTDNVYWAKKSSSLGNRQKWIVEQTAFDPDYDTILPHAQPYIQRDLTWDYLSTPGNFEENACAVCALTTCEGIRREDDGFTPASCKEAKGFIGDSVEAKWKNLNMVQHFDFTPQEAYQEIYNQISMDLPAIIHVDNGYRGHFVTAYGYTFGTDEGNITPERILIIDPYNPERTNLQELLNHCPSSGGYDFLITY